MDSRLRGNDKKKEEKEKEKALSAGIAGAILR